MRRVNLKIGDTAGILRTKERAFSEQGCLFQIGVRRLHIGLRRFRIKEIPSTYELLRGLRAVLRRY